MIFVLRIAGQAGIQRNVDETLRRMNIHRKYASTFVDGKDENFMGMIQKAREHIAYDEISDELAKEIIAKRGQTKDGKPVKDAEKILEEIKKGNWKIKKFFRLHPPRGGFKKGTKLEYPKGVLGHNKDLNKLIVRML